MKGGINDNRGKTKSVNTNGRKNLDDETWHW